MGEVSHQLHALCGRGGDGEGLRPGAPVVVRLSCHRNCLSILRGKSAVAFEHASEPFMSRAEEYRARRGVGNQARSSTDLSHWLSPHQRKAERNREEPKSDEGFPKR